MRVEAWAEVLTRGRARTAFLLTGAGMLLAVAWQAGGAELWADHAARGRLRHLLAVVCLVGLVQLLLVVLPLGAIARRRSEAELDRAWFVQQVLDALPVGVAATDVTGHVVVNQVARRRRGLPETGEVTPGEFEAALRGQVITVLDPQPRLLAEQDKPTRRALAGLDTDLTVQISTVRHFVDRPGGTPGADEPDQPVGPDALVDGPPITGAGSRLSVHGRPLRDRSGRVIGSIVVDQDLTGVHESNLMMQGTRRDTELVADAVRAILRHRDGRASITHAAQVIASAAVVALFEPDRHGDLVCSHATAASMVGRRVPCDSSSVLAQCYSAGRPIWSQDIHADPRADHQLHAQIEADVGVVLTSGAWYPITTNGQCLGVLVIACPSGVPAPDTHAETLDLLASETALALAHENLLRETQRLSNSDPLTAAANRRAWETALAQELPRALHQQRPLSMLLIDFDHFKAFNDTHGHPAGDSLLREAAHAWTERLRPGDVLCRWGGEEFAVLLPDCDLLGATQVAEQLRTLMPRNATCSIGVAEWDLHESHHDLAQRADHHLYTAKNSGRDRVHAGRLWLE